jgi:Mannosyl-glycoprotein endo-beta-N-acetylglucosaminidase
MFGVYNSNLISKSINRLNNFKSSIKIKPVGSTKIQGRAIEPKTSYDENKIQNIINKYSKNKSPLSAKDYINASNATGVPVDALLTQGALESSFATAGAGRKNNVGNVFNFDSRNKDYAFASQYEGLIAQANVLKKEYNYEGGFDADKFIQNDFKRPKGGRYASDPKYGEKYTSILNNVRNLLKN